MLLSRSAVSALSLFVIGLTLGFGNLACGQEDDALADATAEVAEAAIEPIAEVAPPAVALSWQQSVDAWFGKNVNSTLATPLFFDLGPYLGLKVAVPIVVVWLALGAIFLTIRMGFINFRAFWHAIRVVKGDYDTHDDTEEGEVTHFQALSSALSATVGLGNIGSVAVAVGIGGPGAIFWMVMCGLFGMSSKFTECTLGQMYREVGPDGHVLGGPMRYLSSGLREMKLGLLGKFLAVLFAVLCIGASFGGGCAFQVSQSRLAVNEALTSALPIELETLNSGAGRAVYGGLLAVLVGIVIIGGIKRIAATAEKIVPLMCVVYVTTAVIILLMNFSLIDDAFAEIFRLAWAKENAYGGAIGAAMLGIKRAAFSNEAGIGSAAIAHSAAKTRYAVREGIVALLEPFIDTVLICTITGLVIVITGVCNDPVNAEIVAGSQGAKITSLAFGTSVSWFPYVLAVAVLLFAYSTMISWSYYGERCATSLFGPKASFPYRLLFLVAVFLGAIIEAKNVLDFSDLMILAMSVPNMIGLYLLSGKVKGKLNEYWGMYKQTDFKA